MAEKALPLLRENLSQYFDEINGKAGFLLVSLSLNILWSRIPSPRSQSAKEDRLIIALSFYL